MSKGETGRLKTVSPDKRKDALNQLGNVKCGTERVTGLIVGSCCLVIMALDTLECP
jgi:hypothetical protein